MNEETLLELKNYFKKLQRTVLRDADFLIKIKSTIFFVVLLQHCPIVTKKTCAQI